MTACLKVRPGHEKPHHESIRAWIHEELGRHKAPQHILWVGKGELIEEYPVTGSGKFQKHIMSAMATKALRGAAAKL